jgi:hypothetical protein
MRIALAFLTLCCALGLSFESVMAQSGSQRRKRSGSANKRMTGADDKAMADHAETTLGLAEKILKSAGNDANEAFLTAIGTLAQVMFITVADGDREEMIGAAAEALRNYLKLLEELSGGVSQVEKVLP